jgi:RNA polymerase sigma-70 factor (ECF subfamily)
MNAPMFTPARSHPRKASEHNGIRLVDIENQAAPAALPLTPPAVAAGSTQSTWPDAWLINAVRRDPPDEDALSALVDRYWKTVYARCRLMSSDREAASDLAQEAWLRVLRARHSLEPDGNFHGYIITIATNLWRDRNRVAQRAGAAAEGSLASLDAAIVYEGSAGGERLTLVDVIADPRSLSNDDQMLLEMDMDHALERLSPHLRDSLVSRFITGESAAEIGRRYNRTEQTVTGWIREAVREMKIYLAESDSLGARAED